MSSPAAVIRVRILTSAAAVAPAMLGAAPNSRIFHLAAPQGTPRPYIVYGRVGGAPEHHMLGAGGLMQERVHIEGHCDKAADMEALSEIVRLTCDAYRGRVTVDGVELGSVPVAVNMSLKLMGITAIVDRGYLLGVESGSIAASANLAVAGKPITSRTKTIDAVRTLQLPKPVQLTS